MTPFIKPIQFVSPLSEVEVRMALRELCGSKFDNYPFKGEVNTNFFRLIRNNFVMTRGVPNPILLGEFFEQNEKTHVTVSIQTSIIDIVGLCIVVLGGLCLTAYSFISMLTEGFIVAIASAMSIAVFVSGVLLLNYLLIRSSFRRSVAKIKKALSNISL